MLVNKKADLTNKVVSIKFTSGEEVIALVNQDNRDNNRMSISSPLLMVMMTDDSTQGTVVFVPWIIGVQDNATVEISTNSIVTINIARDDATEQYRQSAGLVDPQPKIKSSEPPMVTATRGGRGR